VAAVVHIPKRTGMFVSPQQSQTSTTGVCPPQMNYSSKSYCKHNLIAVNFYPARKRKRTVCHQESTTAKEKLKLALQSHGAPNHDLPGIVVFHLHTLLCGVALAATLPP